MLWVTFFSWSHQAFRQRLIIFGGAQDVSTLYSLEPAPAKGGVLWTFGAAHARAAPSKPESHCLPCCYHGEHMDVNPHEGLFLEFGLAKDILELSLNSNGTFCWESVPMIFH